MTTPLERLEAARAASARRRDEDRRAAILAWLQSTIFPFYCDSCVRIVGRWEAVFAGEFMSTYFGGRIESVSAHEERAFMLVCAECASRPAWLSVVLARGGMVRGAL